MKYDITPSGVLGAFCQLDGRNNLKLWPIETHYFHQTVVLMGVEVKREGKVFYKIGEVAEITKLPAYVLRFWESEFNFFHPKKSQGKHRVYTAADVETVMEIKRMLYVEGYTIAGLKRHWNRRRRDGGAPSVNRERVKKAKSELRTILKMLKSPPL